MQLSSLDELIPTLRCPASGEPLVIAGDALVSRGGAHAYPVIGGVPILIARDKSLFDPADYARGPRSTRRGGVVEQTLRRMLTAPPTLNRNLVGEENCARLLELVRARASPGRRPWVLIVGGATVGVGVGHLLAADDVEVIATDVELTPQVRLVCDGHDLPFEDQVFDAVVCQAVLEHVLEPQRVADEIWRVLAQDGYVYSEIPFMQQVHLGAFDFTRFTHLGHRRLWRRFDEIASGADSGPGMALSWSLMYFLRSPLPTRYWPLVDRIVSLLFFWLKYLDRRLVTHAAGLDAACGTYFLGRRRDSPEDDRQIVRGYRGALAARLGR